MDDEHKELIARMNNVYLLNENEAPKVQIQEALNALFEYTKKHFADEEAYMEGLHFPEIAQHKRAHVDVLARLKDDIAKFDGGASQKLSSSFFGFLQFWLKTHIQGIDFKYGYFAQRQSHPI